MLLQPLKHALKGAILEFRSDISYRLDNFTDNSMMLLSHFEKKLQPIADSCRSYKFKIGIDFDYSVATNMIAKVLQFGPISGCSDVSLNLFPHRNFMTVLLVDAISNWLNRIRTYGAISANGQAIKERILEIDYIPYIYISEMLNCIKKVNFNSNMVL